MNRKILIVDDSRLARMAVIKALNALRPDWIRVEAGDADEALRRLEEEGADVALMDFNMPGRDGLVLAGEIHERRPDMPLALISANIQDEVVAATRRLGAAFLAKPLSERALGDFLTAADLRLRRAAGG